MGATSGSFVADRLTDMVTRALALMFFLAGAALQSEAAQAQGSAPRLNAAASDSALWQRVMDFLVERNSRPNKLAAIDTAPRPWIFRINADEPWRSRMETQLMAVFHGRPWTPNDPVKYIFELGPVRLVNDTAYVHVVSEQSRGCPNSSRRQGGKGISDVVVPRALDGSWLRAVETRNAIVADYVC